MKKLSAVIAAVAVGIIASGGYFAYAGAPQHPDVSHHDTSPDNRAAAAECGKGTIPILVNGAVHCKIVLAKGAPCPPGSVLVREGGKDSCAHGAIAAWDGGSGTAGQQDFAPGPDQPAVADDQPDQSSSADDNTASDPGSLGTPSCPAGYTLVDLNGTQMCKGKTHLVCDKERLRHLMPPNAIRTRWIADKCVWRFQLPN